MTNYLVIIDIGIKFSAPKRDVSEPSRPQY